MRSTVPDVRDERSGPAEPLHREGRHGEVYGRMHPGRRRVHRRRCSPPLHDGHVDRWQTAMLHVEHQGQKTPFVDEHAADTALSHPDQSRALGRDLS